MRTIGSRLAVTLALFGALFTSACDSTGPDTSTYRLEMVNGNALPFPYMMGSGLEVIAGEFQVLPGHDIDGWIQIRCQPVQAPGTECHVEGDGRIVQEGIWNGMEHRFYPTGGGWFPMQLEADDATIQYGQSFELHYQYERLR